MQPRKSSRGRRVRSYITRHSIPYTVFLQSDATATYSLLVFVWLQSFSYFLAQYMDAGVCRRMAVKSSNAWLVHGGGWKLVI